MPSDSFSITDAVAIGFNPPNFSKADTMAFSDIIAFAIQVNLTPSISDSLSSYNDQVDLSLDQSANNYYRRYLNDVKR